MKTKTSTKILLMLAGTVLGLGNVNAQTAMPEVNQTGGVSAITTGGDASNGGGPGKWSGYTFGDYAYMGHGDSAGRGYKTQYAGLGSAQQIHNPAAFEIRRAYLQYDYDVNSKFSGTALLAYEGDYDVTNKRTVFVKYAYLRWKQIFKGTDLKVGIQPTNSFATAYGTEPLMQYRAVEKTVLDMHGVDGSYDMGLMLEGKLWKSMGGDTTKAPTFIGYSIMVGDNSGAPVPGFTPTSGIAFNNTTDACPKFRANVFLNTMGGALTVGLYTDYINYGNVPMKGSSTQFFDQTQTVKAYAAFNKKAFGIGFEWFIQTNKNGEIVTYTPGNGTNDTTNAVQSGFSVWANATIIPNKLRVFAMYDSYNPDTKYTNNKNATYKSRIFGQSANTITNTYSYTENFLTVGLDWSPTTDKKVHFMPNLWYDMINNGVGADALKSDNYMVYRLTFLYTFK